MSRRQDPSSALKPATPEELELDWGARERRSGASGEPVATATPPETEPDPDAGAGKGPPGEPKHMSLALRYALAGLLSGPHLRMRQMREALELLVGWETRNRYEVCDETGRPVVYVGETGGGWGAALKRNLWPFHRIRLECLTLDGTLALVVERPWTFLFARAEVTAWDGRVLGHIQQRFRFFGRCLEIRTPGGAVVATLEGPWWKPWTFRVLQREQEVAVVRKKWSGLIQELMTDADTFSLDFAPACTDGRLRQLILAAALLVDLTYFEKRSGSGNRGSLFGLLDGLSD